MVSYERFVFADSAHKPCLGASNTSKMGDPPLIYIAMWREFVHESGRRNTRCMKQTSMGHIIEARLANEMDVMHFWLILGTYNIAGSMWYVRNALQLKKLGDNMIKGVIYQ